MAQKNEEVIVLDVADSQTILAGDPIKIVSGYATKNSSDLNADTMGIALTDATFTTVAAEGVRKKLGILTTGKFDFTGLVENDNSGTYTTNISPGDPVSIYWSSGIAYVVNSTTNPIGTAQASLTGNENTTKEKEGVGTIVATGLALDNVPVTSTIHIEVPGKVFTVTEDAGSAAAGVCDVTLSTKALIFNSADVTTYSGQQVYAKYDYDANADVTGSVEVRLSFLPKDSVISSEIAPGAIEASDLDSTASFTMGGLIVNNDTATSVTVLNNLSVGGNITGNISDTTFGDLTIATADFTGAGTAVEVTNNISAGGTVVGSNLNVTDWDNVETVVSNNSVGWENVDSLVNTNSQGWENAESTLNTNSAEWEAAQATLNSDSTGWENAESVLNTNSTGWENVESIVNTNSADWEAAESTLNTNSGTWLVNNANDTTTGDLSVNALKTTETDAGEPVFILGNNSTDAAGSIVGYVPVTVNGSDLRMPFYAKS